MLQPTGSSTGDNKRQRLRPHQTWHRASTPKSRVHRGSAADRALEHIRLPPALLKPIVGQDPDRSVAAPDEEHGIAWPSGRLRQVETPAPAALRSRPQSMRCKTVTPTRTASHNSQDHRHVADNCVRVSLRRARGRPILPLPPVLQSSAAGSMFGSSPTPQTNSTIADASDRNRGRMRFASMAPSKAPRALNMDAYEIINGSELRQNRLK